MMADLSPQIDAVGNVVITLPIKRNGYPLRYDVGYVELSRSGEWMAFTSRTGSVIWAENSLGGGKLSHKYHKTQEEAAWHCVANALAHNII